MKMIVGLGSPGTKHQHTKHSISFMVVDQIACEYQAAFKKNPFEVEIAEPFHNRKRAPLVKPQTFMSESGRAAGPLMAYSGIYPEELAAICDDLDLAVRKIRLRQRRSADERNGTKSIISHLNASIFDRIKVGIGRPKGKRTVAQHVPSPFSRENQPLIEENIFQSVKIVGYLMERHSFMDTMNQFN